MPEYNGIGIWKRGRGEEGKEGERVHKISDHSGKGGECGIEEVEAANDIYGHEYRGVQRGA